MSFSEQIKDFEQKYNAKVTSVFRGACGQVSVDIAEGSPVSTGTLLGKWEPSVNSPSSNTYQGGMTAWLFNKKDKGIANANRAQAMSNLLPRISEGVNGLSKNDTYYFTNDTHYIMMAEYEGWAAQGGNAGPYHMRENAVLNWQEIVNSRINV